METVPINEIDDQVFEDDHQLTMSVRQRRRGTSISFSSGLCCKSSYRLDHREAAPSLWLS